MEALWFIYLLVMLVAWVSLSSCVCKTAHRLNRDGDMWFLFSIFFSPILGALMVHCLGPIKKEEKTKPAWLNNEKKNDKILKESDDECILREADARIAAKKDEKVKPADAK